MVLDNGLEAHDIAIFLKLSSLDLVGVLTEDQAGSRVLNKGVMQSYVD